MKNSIKVVLVLLKSEYFHSEVTSGEFIHTCPIPDNILGNEISREDVILGIQEFLNWDDSEEGFDVIKFGNTWYTTEHFRVHEDFFKYKGINYPTKLVTVTIDDHDDIWGHTYLISVESLHEALDKVDDEFSGNEANIDNNIYHYVEDKYWDLPLEEICKKHLDLPMTLKPQDD